MSSNKAFVAIRCVPLTVYEFVVTSKDSSLTLLSPSTIHLLTYNCDNLGIKTVRQYRGFYIVFPSGRSRDTLQPFGDL